MKVLKDPKARPWIVKGIGKIVEYEIKKLCSDSTNSVQRSKRKQNICNFPWASIRSEIMEYCPTLYSLLLSSTTTKAIRHNQMHVISVVVCMLCKFRRSNMSLLQRMVSTLLYAGHVGTAV